MCSILNLTSHELCSWIFKYQLNEVAGIFNIDKYKNVNTDFIQFSNRGFPNRITSIGQIKSGDFDCKMAELRILQMSNFNLVRNCNILNHWEKLHSEEPCGRVQVHLK